MLASYPIGVPQILIENDSKVLRKDDAFERRLEKYSSLLFHSGFGIHRDVFLLRYYYPQFAKR